MIRHHLRLCELAATTLSRQWAKTAVVVVVYSLLIAAVASLMLYVGALRRESRLLLDGSPELIVQRLVGGRHEPIPASRAASIAGIRGVRAVGPRIWGYSWDPPTGATFTVWAADTVPRESLEPLDGESLLEGSPGAGECLVGQGVADVRFLWVGQRLILRRADGGVFAPRVVGLFRAESSILTNDLVVLRPEEARAVLGLAAGEATDLAVEIHHPREVETVARKIAERWPDVRTVSREQILSTWDAVFDWRSGLWVAFLLSSVAAFGILVWDRATGLSARELHTIGVLKAVGWKPRDVLELCFWQGLLVSGIALLTGLLLAWIHLVWLDSVVFDRLLRGWSVLFPPIEARPGADLPAFLVCAPLAVMPYLVASLIPWWRASITDADTILRG